MVVTLLFPLFLATANRTQPYNVDTMTNVLSAAAIGQTGSPILDGASELADPDVAGVVGWVVGSPRGPVSKYPPGAALFASPFYVFAGGAEVQRLYGTNDPDLPPVDVRVPSLAPASVAASLSTTVAVALIVVATRSLVGLRWALAAGFVLAAGTGLWVNAAHRLWQHGPAAMWLALGAVAASRDAWFGSGVAYGLGILTRPTLAFASSGLGVVAAWRRRNWRPVLLHGGGAALGLAMLYGYNHWLWGEWTVTGGYESAFAENLTTGGAGWYLRNVLGGFFAAERGIFVWSPVLAVAALGLPKVWRDLPAWASGAFVGGVVLLLVQFRLNRYSGGFGFYSYRYPIESVVAAAPALAVAAKDVWARGGVVRRLLVYATASSVALHVAAVVAQTVS